MTYTYDPVAGTYTFTPARLALHDRRVAATKEQCEKWDDEENERRRADACRRKGGA